MTAAALASWLIAATWKGTLLLAFVLLVRRVAGNRIPSRWLCALLLVALVRLIAPVTPAAPFSVFNLVPASVTGAPVMLIVDEAQRPAQAFARSPLPIAPPNAGTPWIPALLAVWGAGAAFLLVRTGWQMFRFHRQLADSVPVVRDDVAMLVDECRTQLGVRRRIRVASTSAVATPSLHGWLRPTLLLPHGFLVSFTREQLRYVVLHELAHLRRSDVLVNWIATAAQVLHWFNPLVRVALTRLAEERELACDELALEALGAEERPAYGGTVLEIVDRMRAAPMVPALVGMTATPQQLKRRIVMIASFRRQSRHSLGFAALAVLVGLATLTDARAGEVHIRHAKHGEELNPATKVVVDSLDQLVSVELTAVPLEDVLRSITSLTGTSVRIAEGALDDAARQARVTLKGANVPARVVLAETLSAFKLGLKVSDAGAEVIKPSDDEHEGMIRMRVHEGAGPAGDDGHRVMIRRDMGEAHEKMAADMAHAVIHRMVETTENTETDGVARRKVKYVDEKNREGTLEVEVKR